METEAVAQETIEIPRSGTPEYANWRVTGELPEKKQEPKPAEPAAAEPKKESGPEKGETAPGPEPGKAVQEKRRKPGAEARIQQLTERQRQLERELEEARRPKTQAEPSPARQPEYTRPKPTPEDKGKDGAPRFANYEEYVEELADWKAEQRIVAQQREQQAAQVRQTVGQKLEEARKRYQDFDASAAPVLQELLTPGMPPAVIEVLNDSPVLADVLYTIGGSEESKRDFLTACRTNPSKALRVAIEVERLVTEELAKQTAPRTESGRFAKPVESPAKRSPESATEPPIEVGHRGAVVADESARAFQEIERGNAAATRAWLRAENQKALRRRGA